MQTASSRRQRFPFSIQLTLFVVMLALLFTLACSLGYIRIPFAEVARIIVSRTTGLVNPPTQMDALWPVIIFDVRMPRILTAAIVGGGLAACGTVFQGILLNPLADPYTLGVSAGAAFGAAVALLFNWTVWGAWSLPLCAFAGAALTLAAVIYLSASSGGVSSNNLILSGIIVAAILSAGISFLKYMADEQVAVIIFWLMGSFVSRTWGDVLLTLGFLVPALVIFIYYARELNVITLGSRTAVSLGVDTARVRLILLITASLMTAVCVSVSGIIGFVGLLVPHLMRALTGPDHRLLLPATVLVGAILLLAADTVTRALLPNEIPIGVITALLGGPVFCYVFRQRQQLMGGGR